jgi:hypothetical protein
MALLINMVGAGWVWRLRIIPLCGVCFGNLWQRSGSLDKNLHREARRVARSSAFQPYYVPPITQLSSIENRLLMSAPFTPCHENPMILPRTQRVAADVGAPLGAQSKEAVEPFRRVELLHVHDMRDLSRS